MKCSVVATYRNGSKMTFSVKGAGVAHIERKLDVIFFHFNGSGFVDQNNVYPKHWVLVPIDPDHPLITVNNENGVTGLPDFDFLDKQVHCHSPLSISVRQKKNFEKLATYLMMLPYDYKHFDMECYGVHDGREVDSPNNPHVLNVANDCGTVACAAGHAPAAGIAPHSDDWNDYVAKEFCLPLEYGQEYDWCFSGMWTDYDNTPHGAAKRIFYMLRNGVPYDFSQWGEEQKTEFFE